jgi:hypothetical protein
LPDHGLVEPLFLVVLGGDEQRITASSEGRAVRERVLDLGFAPRSERHLGRRARHLDTLRRGPAHGHRTRDTGEVLQADAERPGGRERAGLHLRDRDLRRRRVPDHDEAGVQRLERVLVRVGVVDRDPEGPASGLHLAERERERRLHRLLGGELRPDLAPHLAVAEEERGAQGVRRLVPPVPDADLGDDHFTVQLDLRSDRDADAPGGRGPRR